MSRGPTVLCACLLLIVLAVGCGVEPRADQQPSTKRERTDVPVPPPPGWRTIRGERIGFTMAAPKTWPVRQMRTSTLIRSADNAVAVTVIADRSVEGRQSDPGSYGRRVIEQLPEFKGKLDPGFKPIPRTPYESALVRATGTIRGSSQQRITVGVITRPELVSYSVVILADAGSKPGRNERTATKMLHTLRAGPPARTS